MNRQQHDHRISGGIVGGIDLLKLLHCLQSHGRSRVAQAKNISGEVYGDITHRRMPARHGGKQRMKNRLNNLHHDGNEPTRFGDFHQPQP